jgi:hypothetical protein
VNQHKSSKVVIARTKSRKVKRLRSFEEWYMARAFSKRFESSPVVAVG